MELTEHYLWIQFIDRRDGVGRRNDSLRTYENCVVECVAVEMARDRDRWRKFMKAATADRTRPNRG